MFKKILLCTDLSEFSQPGIDCVCQLKALGVQEVILAHVIYVAATPGLDISLTKEAEPVLAEMAQTLAAAGFVVTTAIPLGKPAYALDSLAEKHDVSLVVISSHGKGLLSSLVLGSVSEKLLQLSRRPVLLVRNKTLQEGKECLTACSRLFDRILYPTDFSDASEVAFSCLEQITSRTKASVTLITSRPQDNDPVLDDKLRKIDLARLERMKTSLQGKGAASVQALRDYGKAPEAILKAARTNGCSLIVMGTHGRGILAEASLGSCAHQVARQAEIPILFTSSAICSCL